MDFFKKIIVPLILMILILVGVSLAFFLWHPHLQLDEKEYHLDHAVIYYVLAVSITAALVLLAWLKSGEALEQSKISYLLRIDERWLSIEIIEAREVIHELYLAAEELNPERDNEEIKSIIAHQIMALKDNKDKIKPFIKLLNFLDFFETIGYLHDKKAITTEEVSELLGNSIIYFYDIFSLYISYRRNTKDPKFYIKFEKLYLELKERKVKCKEKSLSN